jgi:transcriptional regulator with GAF, ATPase, and Fis domain
MDALLAYPWPGNVRELENVIERAVILSEGPELELGEWLRAPAPAPAPPGVVPLDEAQRQHILRALELTGWVVSGKRGAAKVLGLKPTTLQARMKKLGIRRPSRGRDEMP